MKKIRLFTPGPTMVPEDVMLEMARPMEHHRTSWYRDMHKELCELLQYMFQTKATCLTFTGSGTSAMEGAIVGCCPPRSRKALVVQNGKFAERWVKVCSTFGIDHTILKLDYGQGCKAEQVLKALEGDRSLDTVIVVHSETSTTALSDVQGIAKVTHAQNTLLLVDGITAVGAIPVKMDEWGVDVYVTGSQKAMMLPPGLAFAAVNDRAWTRIDSGKTPTLYNDFKAYRKSLETFDAPFTPAVSLVRGAVFNLKRLKAMTLETVWKETAVMAKAMRAAVEAMKLKLYAADPADSVTAITVPDGIEEAVLRKTMSTKYGFHIAGGQGDMKGKIVRFSHMGYVDAFDTLGAIAAFEMTLKAMGYNVAIGTGVSAAQKVFAEGMG